MDVSATHRPARFFVLRSPLLAGEVLLELLDSGIASPPPHDEDDEALTARLGESEARALARLVTIVNEPHVREAIFVATPSLDAAIEAWRRHPEGKGAKKIALAVLRYVARMSTRSTPFGLFSTVSVGELSERTALRTAPIRNCRPHARLDTHLLCAVVDRLFAGDTTRGAIALTRSPSLYQCAGRLRYAHVSLSDLAAAFPLVDATPSKVLLAVLERARTPASRQDLVAAVREGRSGISEAAARAFVDQVALQGMLVPAIMPALTGPEPARPLIEALRVEAAFSEASDLLEAATSALEEASKLPVGDGRASYERALATIDRLPTGFERMPTTTIQVELERPLEERSLGPAPATELLRVASLLREVTPPRRSRELERFRTRFEERFGRREVPLLQALDEDFGVGLGKERSTEQTALIRDLPFARGARSPGAWTDRERWLAEKLHAALRKGDTVLEIDRDPSQPPSTLPLPDTFSALGSIHGSQADVDAGNFVISKPAFSAPAAALLSRFCHASAAIHANLREVIAAEESLAHGSGVILADVVNLTLGRMANIQLRPQLYSYEVVCHGRSSAPPERQIPTDDLLVSVVRDEVVLWSKRLERRVVPVIPSAYNAHIDAATVYRFLDLVSRQSADIATDWTWGVFESSSYLPAVRTGRTLLASQRWKVPANRLRPITEAKSAKARYRATRSLREELGIPPWVAVVSSDTLTPDNFIPVNLDHPLGVDLLVQAASGAGDAPVTLRDFSLERQSRRLLETNDGTLFHEVIVSFVRQAPVATKRVDAARRRPTEDVERSFPPGSSVLYVAIHGMVSRFDDLILEVIRPFAERARAEGHATKWHFVRYSDPSDHLRVRFFGGPSLWTTLLPALHAAMKPVLERGAAWGMKIETYEREVERYGGPLGVTLAEDWFCADSEACAALLALLAETGEEEARWQLVGLGFDALLVDFGLDLPARAEIARAQAASYVDELGGSGSKDLARALGQRSRELAREASALVGERPSERSLIARAREIFRARSVASAPTIASLRAGVEDGSITLPLTSQLVSYVHMSADRLFASGSALRAQELVVWELMNRAYRGALARDEARG